jgi:hypothetical protein
MSILEELTELFRTLGARDPESWANSQISEGINQLGRFLFLCEAWRKIQDEDDQAWIQAYINRATKMPEAPRSGIGPALQRLLDKGADPQDITDIVRIRQYELLFDICYLLSGPGLPEPKPEGFSWALFQVDEEGKPISPIDGLHESVLETDPTGREMRPRQPAT